jgi:alkanesulfonate monooxygenase SsuD/methylene tetrahydromethanopterin reductase-like flavin-dependent oxidoreductase (luciferase family)
VQDAIGRAIIGSPQTVHGELADLLERTGADELMLTSQVADPEQRIEGIERIAEAFELTPRAISGGT